MDKRAHLIRFKAPAPRTHPSVTALTNSPSQYLDEEGMITTPLGKEEPSPLRSFRGSACFSVAPSTFWLGQRGGKCGRR